MAHTKNLVAEEAIEKISHLVEKADICLFATNLTQIPLAAVPMSTQDVDEEGTLWFLSSRTSNHNRNIEKDTRVQLFYSNKKTYEFVSIFGEATIIKDKEKAREIWTPIAKTWFHEGVDDPELTIIKVKPLDGHYWDTKSNKVVSLLKMAAGAITGKTLDDGREGTLRV
jgi:general stress protein 26